MLSAIGNTANVAGGTAWLWARPDAAGAVDVLFIDEAAQMSLANVLAVSQAARSVVLLGDPQQLEQPMQGSHPEGTDVSALHHILGGHQTIAADRGLFLEETWRLHPEICRFTSELFYEGRLQPRPGLEVQDLYRERPGEWDRLAISAGAARRQSKLFSRGGGLHPRSRLRDSRGEAEMDRPGRRGTARRLLMIS